MSSSPRLTFESSDDVPMDDGDQQNPQNPGTPLFLPGGTPSERGAPQYGASSSPLRRRVGQQSVAFAGGMRSSSPPMDFPSSETTTGQTPRARRGQPSDANRGSGLSFPASLSSADMQDSESRQRIRRGDIHSSIEFNSPGGQNNRNRVFPVPGGGSDASALFQSDQVVPEEELDDPRRAIWGTNVNLSGAMQLFSQFLRGYKNAEGIRIYEQFARRMRRTGETNLNLDINHLKAHKATTRLHSQLMRFPQEIVPMMDVVLKDFVTGIAEQDKSNGVAELQGRQGEEELRTLHAATFKVRPFGDKAMNMRDLNPGDTDRLISIKGLIIRVTPIIPDMKGAFFRCLNCSHTHTVGIDRGRIAEPDKCPREVCGAVGAMTLVHNRSEFADRQVIRLQETPDAVPDGQTPHTVALCGYDELVDLAKPGDRVTISGIFRAVPTRVNPRQRTVRSVFRTYVDVLHILRGDGSRVGMDKSTRVGEARAPGVGVGGGDDADEEEIMETDENGTERVTTRKAELEAKVKELGLRPDVYELLARSLAPSIWGMDDVKKGILLQLFGGTNKSISRGGGAGGPRYRGDINVLLVGDPGVSKSQILSYVHKIAPRGVYTSGKGSSAVGLTAYVTRDPDSKQLVLESGALVLSDGGVCCIDEFDKMSDATRSVLHEVMEQQTVSIAKAGIITTLNARTSILAAANPINSKYDAKLPITKNIDLPPTLISRFDLLYLIVDRVDESADRRLAQHLVDLYTEDAPETGGEDILPAEVLSAYITYARSRVNPEITEAAGKELTAAYVALRGLGGSDPRAREHRITATTRQLESMIRLSEAHARMRLSKLVEVEDVREANRLLREAIRASATDPTTGLIDLDLINTGAGQQQRKLRGDMRREILALLEGAPGRSGVKWVDAVKQLGEQSSITIDSSEFSDVVRALETEGVVKIVGDRERRVIRKVSAE